MQALNMAAAALDRDSSMGLVSTKDPDCLLTVL